MLDFFIALFGGIYFGGKYLMDKAENEAIDRHNTARCESMRADYNRFIAKMTSEELERQAKRGAYSEKYKGLIDKVVSDLFTKAKSKGINTEDDYGRQYKMVDIYPDFRILIIMASMGKLPRSVASFGINRPPFKRDAWDLHALFMDWVDKELQSHGVEPMVFQSEMQQNMAITGVPVLAKNAQKCCGRFGWWSMRLFL